jgi:hypothetical protein
MKNAQLLALSAALLVTAFAPARATPPQDRGRGLSTREFDTAAPAGARTEAQTDERAGNGVPCVGSSGGTSPLVRATSEDPSPARRGPRPCEPEQSPAWYMDIGPFDFLVVSDSHGNTDRLYEQAFAFKKVRHVTYSPSCTELRCLTIIMPVGETYTFKFRSARPMRLELVRGVGNTRPDAAVRYLDLYLPKGAWGLLKVTPRGPEDLRVDKDGDGRFEAAVRPTASLTGAAALDTDGPSVEFSAAPLDAGNVLLTINATDPSGVRRVLYSFDGSTFEQYAGPFKVEASRVSDVQAFADDKAGNRSGTYAYESAREPLRRRP